METNLRKRLSLKRQRYVAIVREAIIAKDRELAYRAACILGSFDSFPTKHAKDLFFDWIYEQTGNGR